MSKRNHIVGRASDVNGGQYIQTNHSYNSGYEDGKKAGKEYCASVIESLREQVEKLTESYDQCGRTVQEYGRTITQTELRLHEVATHCVNVEEQLTVLAEQNKQLKAELKSIDGALDDPRANLTLTTSEIIWELKEQVEKLTKELSVLKTTPPHLRQDLHCVASDLSAQVRERDEQLTAALAACEKKDEALDADNSKLWPSKLREEAISIQPDASALNEYRNQVIEECATCCEEHQGSAQTCANAIRGLKK